MGEKKFWNKKNAIAMIIALLMVSSVIGIWTSSDTGPTTKYKGHVLTARDNMWWIKQGKAEIAFNFHPLDVENISMDPEINEKLDTLMFYVTFDPEKSEYIDLIRFSMASALQAKGAYIESGITKESEEYDLPVIDCSNATSFVPVVKFEISEENKTILILEDNCIIAQAKDEVDMVKIKDRIIYGLLGII
jgi:hypothetical protein